MFDVYLEEDGQWSRDPVTGPYASVDNADDDYGADNVRLIVDGRVYALYDHDTGYLVGLLVRREG